jgi:hypothetical protein
MAPSGIETTTFWLVAQCLNQLRHQQRALSPDNEVFKITTTFNTINLYTRHVRREQ